MSLSIVTLMLVGLAVIAFLSARARATLAAKSASRSEVHSRPVYHGVRAGLFAIVPAVLLLIVWAIVGDGLIVEQTIASLAPEARPDTALQRQAFVNELKAVASGALPAAFNPNVTTAVPIYRELAGDWTTAIGGLALLLAAIGGGFAWLRTRASSRARTQVETFALVMLAIASLIAILTTFGIVLSLLYESIEFFRRVSPMEFIFGTQWSPQTAIRADQVGSSGAFGAVP
ncbi:MAG: phosphate ABC transporter permease family protein, partial [Pacificimonas sp.]